MFRSCTSNQTMHRISTASNAQRQVCGCVMPNSDRGCAKCTFSRYADAIMLLRLKAVLTCTTMPCPALQRQQMLYRSCGMTGLAAGLGLVSFCLTEGLTLGRGLLLPVALAGPPGPQDTAYCSASASPAVRAAANACCTVVNLSRSFRATSAATSAVDATRVCMCA